LVVIAIIGVLVALLLPAIQAARNAANRSACSANLKNIALAFHTHNDAHETLPVGAKGLARGTWAVFTLPFLEQEALYDAYGMGNNYNASPNLGLLNGRRLAIYSCPSDGDQKSTYESFKLHNYRVCVGDAAFCDPQRAPGWAIPPAITGVDHPLITELHGAMFWTGGAEAGPHKSFALDQISDGLSNTIAISESIQGARSPSAASVSWCDIRGLIWYGVNTQFTTYLSPNTKQEGTGASLTTAQRDTARADSEGFRADAYPGGGTMHYPDHPIAAPLAGTTETGSIYVVSARSFHTNGVNVGLGDGSVRFVTEAINIAIWRAAGNSDGGESTTLP
jgi:type II secretory pathway pseudopilin PulG